MFGSAGYPGSKMAMGAYQAIINQIPKCKVFVELFAGSAAVSSKLSMSPGFIVVLNDIDYEISQSLLLSVPAGITVYNKDYRDIIKAFDVLDNVVFFADPPYEMSVRSSQRKYYRYDFETSDTLDFISSMSAVSNKVIITHYPCDLYNTSFESWRKVDYESMTRSGLRLERMYMNYEASMLQCCDYVGNDYTDRQRLLRKAIRWKRKLSMLPANEQQYIVKYMSMPSETVDDIYLTPGFYS
ncbi:MAG: DNA adenine methylase [Chitinophagaceae bacterium]|nr:DNA adenine methylase [Chitinophagaceae bacterium]